jgi:hypothetical protein
LPRRSDRQRASQHREPEKDGQVELSDRLSPRIRAVRYHTHSVVPHRPYFVVLNQESYG